MSTGAQGATFGKRWLRFALLVLALLAVDQWTKHLAIEHLRGSAGYSWLGDGVRLQYAENRGAFLGLGRMLSARARFGLLVLGNAALLGGVLAWLAVSRPARGSVWFGAALLVGGGIGNLIDRVARGGVVIDFMNVGLGPVRTGIFNVADMAIMAGIALVMWPQLFAPAPAPTATEHERTAHAR